MAKNNAKKELSDAQYRFEQLTEEKDAVVAASEQLQQTILELEATCQSHLEDKRELKVPDTGDRWRAGRVCSAREDCDECGRILGGDRNHLLPLLLKVGLLKTKVSTTWFLSN